MNIFTYNINENMYNSDNDILHSAMLCYTNLSYFVNI